MQAKPVGLFGTSLLVKGKAGNAFKFGSARSLICINICICGSDLVFTLLFWAKHVLSCWRAVGFRGGQEVHFYELYDPNQYPHYIYILNIRTCIFLPIKVRNGLQIFPRCPREVKRLSEWVLWLNEMCRSKQRCTWKGA